MAKKPLLKSVVYHISPSYRSSRREQLQAALNAHGAQPAPTISKATHIITDTPRFEGYAEADETAEIVTDRWVERSIVLDRVEPPEMYSADPTMLFSGVTATCTDLLPTDETVIKTGITNLGGQWSAALTQNVTHLFALGPGTGSDKYALAMHNQRDTGMKVLLPHWFDDVIRLGTGKLDTKPYEWPEPAVLAGGGKPGGKPDKEKQQLLSTATSGAVPKSRAGEVWAGKKMYLAYDLELGERQEAVVDAIVRAAGQVVGDWKQCDIFVCKYRSGKTFFEVARAGRTLGSSKTIGTLDWVFFVLGTGQLTSPGDRLIHYPVPRRPIEGMPGKVFSITNYTGEARDYLKKLIQGMGAEFNPTMRQGDNPILVAASTESEKAKKGAEWQIPVVNHLWVEDCYMTWRMLPVTGKYITFPPGSDLSGLLCERGMGPYVENEENLRVEEELDRKYLAELERPQLTQGSTMDANEVSAMVDIDADADDDHVEQENTPPGKGSSKVGPSSEAVSRKTSGATGAATSPRKPVSPVKGAGSPAKAPPASPSKAPVSRTKPSQQTKTTSPSKAPVSHAKAAVSPTKLRPVSHQGKPPSSKHARPPSPPARPSTPPSNPPGTPSSDVSMSPLTSPPKRTVKKRAVIEDDEDEDEGEPAEAPPPMASDGEDEDDLLPEPRKKSRAAQGGKGKGKERAQDTTPATAKARGTDAVTPTQSKPRTASKKTSPTEPSSSGPLLGSGKKGDATTRIKKRKTKPVEVSDVESDASPPPVVKGKGKKTEAAQEKASRKKGRQSAARESEDGDDAAAMDIDDIAPAADSDIEFPEMPTQGMPSPPRRRAEKAKSKFVDNEAGADVDEEDEDEEEPGVVHISRSHRQSSAGQGALSSGKRTTSSGKAASSSKAAASSSKVASSSKRSATASKQMATPARKTRTATVLTPQLEVQAREVSTDASSPPPLPRLKKRKSAGDERKEKKSVKKAKKGKGKVKAASPEEDEDEDDAEQPEEEAPPRKKQKMSKADERRASTTAEKPTARTPTTNAEADDDVSMTDVDASMDIANPRGGSRRAAATKAERRLHDTVMPDVIRYETEKRRKSGVSAYEEPSPATEKSKGKGKARPKNDDEAMDVDEVVDSGKGGGRRGHAKRPAAREDDGDDEPEPEPQAAKKAKTAKVIGKASSGDIRMMTTGITLPDNVVAALGKLGVKVVTKPHECTHLVVARIVRTQKFLCALPFVSHVVSEDWAKKSAAQKALLPESDFPVVDKDGEKKQRVKLAELVERARELKGKLFAGHTFFITRKAGVDRDMLRAIVTANGGQISPTNAPTARTFKNDPKTKHLISSKEDAPVWRPIVAEGFKVYTSEVVLDSALRQEVDWDNDAYILPEAKS